MADAGSGAEPSDTGSSGTGAGRSRAKKTPAKKASAKKAAPSPAVKKTAAKKAVVAKKPAAKKTTTKKTSAPAKAASKKTAAKKTAAKATSTPKQPAPKKAAPGVKKAAPAAKKAAPSAKTASTGVTTAPAAQPPAPSPAATPEFPVDPRTLARPWLTAYPPLVPETYGYPPVPLTRLLDDAAKDFPDSIATDFSGRTLTYRRLLEQVDRFASGLSALGVGKGDRVGIALPNCPQHVIALFAVLRLGAIAVEHNPDATAERLGYEIAETGPRVLVVLDAVYAKVAELKGRVPTVEHVVATALADYLPPVVGAVFNLRHRKDRTTTFKIPAGEGVLSFTDIVRRHPPTAMQAPLNPAEDVAVLVFEQEAPRRPVMLSHANLVANVFQVRLWIPDVQAGRETVLCSVPLWHPFGLTAALNFAILSAATMVLVPRFDAQQIITRLVRNKATLFPAAASMLTDIVASSALQKADISLLRACLCDMGPLDPAVAKTFEDATGGRVRMSLGLLEASPMTHANPIYGRAKADRVGLPITDTICVLLDPQDPTRLAPAQGPGELAVHGPQVMRGYWNRPDDTAEVLTGGWLRTGRLAEIDDDGYYRITGRVGAPVA